MKDDDECVTVRSEEEGDDKEASFDDYNDNGVGIHDEDT